MESVRGERDRKLGDEWQDWDGRPVADTQAGKRLFVSLCAGLVVLVGLGGLLAWYMIAPRLSQWHDTAPVVALSVLIVSFVLIAAAFVGITLMLWFRRPLPHPLASMARKFVSHAERGVFSLGRRLSVNIDRTAHSLIKINNTLVRIDEQHVDPSEVLILLPRCLTKVQLKDAQQLAQTYGVHVAVVAGGELARKRIRELQPAAVIGVACERDLLSGIRDVGNRLRVLAIPNERPNGPCKDTSIDMMELREAIEVCTSGGRPLP
jgi:hypothetical protein